jgi:hypothetical protein
MAHHAHQSRVKANNQVAAGTMQEPRGGLTIVAPEPPIRGFLEIRGQAAAR